MEGKIYTSIIIRCDDEIRYVPCRYMSKVIIEGGTMYCISTYFSSHRGNTSDRSLLGDFLGSPKILTTLSRPRNPRILRQGGLCPSRDNPEMVGVSRESQDTQTGGTELRLSQDDPGMVRVFRESQDTQTGGGG